MKIPMTIVIRHREIKIRKRFAPAVKVVKSKKVYNRKHTKNRVDW